jgi:hypothetical protein
MGHICSGIKTVPQIWTWKLSKLSRKLPKVNGWRFLILINIASLEMKGRKRHARETREAALESFKFRKIHQIRILKTQLKAAEEALLLAGGNPNDAQISMFKKLYLDWYY